MAATLTEALKQYHDLKERHPDMLLLFRDADGYYVTYEDDACKLIDLCHDLIKVWSGVASFVDVRLDECLSRLLKAGIRVAVCEQVKN